MQDIGGLSIKAWLTLWDNCHKAGFASADFIAWPDGRSLLEQPALTISVFAMITTQMNLAAKAKNAQ